MQAGRKFFVEPYLLTASLHFISDSPLSLRFATTESMKIAILTLALIAIASSTLVSCTTNDGYPPRGMHNDDPMPAAVRRHQQRMRR